MKFGNLQWKPIENNAGLVSEPTRQAIEAQGLSGILVTEIDAALSDTAAFCEQYKIEPGKGANCVILQAKRAENNWYAVILVPGDCRADVNGVIRRTLEAKKISFAPMEEAVRLTGMEFGAINPIGVPSEWPILLDERIAKLDHTVIGSGKRQSKLLVSGQLLASLPGVQVLDLVKPEV